MTEDSYNRKLPAQSAQLSQSVKQIQPTTVVQAKTQQSRKKHRLPHPTVFLVAVYAFSLSLMSTEEAHNSQKDLQSEARPHKQPSRPPHRYYKNSARKNLSQTGREKENVGAVKLRHLFVYL